ncbi:MAG: UTP--glucose-phosphate uridylyltransferase [Actinomycetota bacterium]|jgi:UTP--glucose-1-phosphate uridylyltransferase
MLPATKSVPKELLPLGEIPALQYVIEEALGAGVDRVIVISSPTKPAISDYLTPSPSVEAILERLGRVDLADGQRRLTSGVEVTVVMQDEPLGLGHAVACARRAVGEEPFFVLLPDELMESSHLLSEMAQIHGELGTSVIAVKPMPIEEISRYGVVAPVLRESRRTSIEPELSERIVSFDDVVEKPQPSEAPSDLAIIGRYLLTSDIFDDLDRVVPGAGGEIQLTDALAAQSQRHPSSALKTTIHRRDIGHPLGWVKAVIEKALAHRDIGDEVRTFIREAIELEPPPSN